MYLTGYFALAATAFEKLFKFPGAFGDKPERPKFFNSSDGRVCPNLLIGVSKLVRVIGVAV